MQLTPQLLLVSASSDGLPDSLVGGLAFLPRPSSINASYWSGEAFGMPCGCLTMPCITCICILFPRGLWEGLLESACNETMLFLVLHTDIPRPARRQSCLAILAEKRLLAAAEKACIDLRIVIARAKSTVCTQVADKCRSRTMVHGQNPKELRIGEPSRFCSIATFKMKSCQDTSITTLKNDQLRA